MDEKIQQTVMKALARNSFTAKQTIEVEVIGHDVILMGEVEHEDLIFEAVATAESVSHLLNVYSLLTVCDACTAVTFDKVPA